MELDGGDTDFNLSIQEAVAGRSLNLRIARTTQRNPDLKNQRKKKKKRNADMEAVWATRQTWFDVPALVLLALCLWTCHLDHFFRCQYRSDTSHTNAQ